MIRSHGREGVLVALSPREANVARLVGANLRPAAIAAELELTEKTVRDYIWRLCQGLGLGSRQDLAFWCLQNPAAVAPLRAPARAGLHPRHCGCGSPVCQPAMPQAA